MTAEGIPQGGKRDGFRDLGHEGGVLAEVVDEHFVSRSVVAVVVTAVAVSVIAVVILVAVPVVSVPVAVVVSVPSSPSADSATPKTCQSAYARTWPIMSAVSAA